MGLFPLSLRRVQNVYSPQKVRRNFRSGSADDVQTVRNVVELVGEQVPVQVECHARRYVGRAAGARVKKTTKPGTAYIHHAMDDHSRLVYCEILADEPKETASAFWTRTNNYFNGCGIIVQRVLTDNGSAYRSGLFAQTHGSITHKRTRPYRPQTNGKVERFTPTIITAATPHSRANHQPTAYPTSVVSTPSPAFCTLVASDATENACASFANRLSTSATGPGSSVRGRCGRASARRSRTDA